MLDLESVRLFVLALEFGNLTRAAEAAGTVQPAVSARLKALEAAWVVREIADAMTPMHAQGIFHERLSPETIIITATGKVKIVGLLMEAVLNPHEMHQATSWSEREATDIVDMGKILYACLVSRWPLGTPSAPASLAALPSGNTRHAQKTWGLAAAPADGHGWLTPRQVQPGVSPALDVLCDQILSQQPRHDEVPVRSASEIYQALARVLGSADAAADLERRLRYPTAAAQRPADARTASAEPNLVSAGRTLTPESAVTRTSVDLPPVIDEEPAPAHAPSVEKSSRAHDPSNLPGESSSVVTVIDGYQMARKGRAGVALGSFYTYFDSKDAIFRAVVQDFSGRVRDEARGAAQAARRPLSEADLRAAVAPADERSPATLRRHALHEAGRAFEGWGRGRRIGQRCVAGRQLGRRSGPGRCPAGRGARIRHEGVHRVAGLEGPPEIPDVTAGSRRLPLAVDRIETTERVADDDEAVADAPVAAPVGVSATGAVEAPAVAAEPVPSDAARVDEGQGG